MMPTGFEWVVIWFTLFINVILPVAAMIAVIVLVVHLVRKGRKGGSSAGASPAVPAGSQAAGAPPASAAPGRLSKEAAAKIDRMLASHNLTDRERDILMGVYAGKTQAQIAEELFLSRSTVGTYCTRAYEKLGVETKDEALALLDHAAADET